MQRRKQTTRRWIAGGQILFALFVALLFVAPLADARVPNRFFGISPQTVLRADDLTWMKRGGIDAIRTDVSWASTEPDRGVFAWDRLDRLVGMAARERIEVFPFIYRTPRWLGTKATVLPIDSRVRRVAWTRFLRAIASRYGPGGTFWEEHSAGSLDPIDPLPIRKWQIWNEPNFFYFTTPASPQRYARLVKISHSALRSVDPGSQLILGGLFAHPRERYPRAMPALKFLRALYRVRGIKNSFEGVGIHPYAGDARRLPRTLAPVRRVIRANGDAGAGLWVTEIGWGSQGAGGSGFEKGLQGQASQLRAAYRYMTSREQKRLNLKQVFWFSWKDVRRGCSFCDSVGLFRAGQGFSPKPAWRVFTQFSGGSATAPPPDPDPPVDPPILPPVGLPLTHSR